MNSRTLLNIGLLALLAGLGLLVIFKPGLKPPPAPTTLSTVDAQNIAHIRIEHQEREPLELEQQQGQWYVKAGQPIPASAFQVRSLLQLANTVVNRSYAIDQLALDKLGLDPPSATVHFGDQLSIEFGNTEPIGGHRYVRVNDTVHLIEDRYQHLVDADLTEFVDHRLLPEGSRITGLHLPQFTLTADNDAHWSLVPEDPDISADAIQELLDTWQHASALWVRKYRGGTAQATVQIQLEGKQDPVMFEVLSMQPELVLARPDWQIQYHLPGESVENMFHFASAATADGPPATDVEAKPVGHGEQN